MLEAPTDRTQFYSFLDTHLFRWSFVTFMLIVNACSQSKQSPFSGTSSSGDENETRTVEISGIIEDDQPIEFTAVDEPVSIVGVNLTGIPDIKIQAYASDQMGDELLVSSEVSTKSFKLKFKAPPEKYIKILIQRQDGAKLGTVLPAPFDSDISAVTTVNRTSTIATKLFDITTKKARSGDQEALQALSDNALAVHHMIQIAFSVNRSLREQTRTQTIMDNNYLNIIALTNARESNRLVKSASVSGLTSKYVQKELSKAAYRTLFSNLSESISPGVLAHRVYDGYHSFDVAHAALIEAWKVSPTAMYPVVSAFQIESSLFRSASTLKDAMAAEETVSVQYATKFPFCAPQSESPETTCIDLAYQPPSPAKN